MVWNPAKPRLRVFAFRTLVRGVLSRRLDACDAAPPEAPGADSCWLADGLDSPTSSRSSARSDCAASPHASRRSPQLLAGRLSIRLRARLVLHPVRRRAALWGIPDAPDGRGTLHRRAGRSGAESAPALIGRLDRKSTRLNS